MFYHQPLAESHGIVSSFSCWQETANYVLRKKSVDEFSKFKGRKPYIIQHGNEKAAFSNAICFIFFTELLSGDTTVYCNCSQTSCSTHLLGEVSITHTPATNMHWITYEITACILFFFMCQYSWNFEERWLYLKKKTKHVFIIY